MMSLPIKFYAFQRNVRRAIFGPGTLESTACERETLCPSERAQASPAIHLPGQFERVTGSPPESTKEREIEQLTCRDVTHAATIAYHFRNVVLIDGQIYAGELKYPVRDESIARSKSASPVYLEKAALASSLLGNRYFGHWLKDDCLTYMLAGRFSKPLCVEPSFDAPHIGNYQRYFNQEWSYTQRAYIDHLVVFQDYGQNRSKRDRCVHLNDAIVHRFGNKRNAPLVFFRRGNTGAPRPIENEPELIEMLLQRGFSVVDAETQSLESLLESLTGARIVVSMEGSHLAHCAFSAPHKSAVLVLQPPDRFASAHRGWTMALGVKFGFVVGRCGETGYIFSGGEILRTLDLLMKAL
jgi:Glycosyltransferase 61